MVLNMEASANVLGDRHSRSFFFYNSNRYTLVPLEFFDPENKCTYLEALFGKVRKDSVRYAVSEAHKSVLVYSLEDSGAEDTGAADCDPYPIVYLLLSLLPKIKDYNKLVVSFSETDFTLVLSQGDNLLLANTYDVADAISASYYIFMVLRKFVINTELTKIYVAGDMPESFEKQMSKYFSGVRKINLKAE